MERNAYIKRNDREGKKEYKNEKERQ